MAVFFRVLAQTLKEVIAMRFRRRRRFGRRRFGKRRSIVRRRGRAGRIRIGYRF